MIYINHATDGTPPPPKKKETRKKNLLEYPLLLFISGTLAVK